MRRLKILVVDGNTRETSAAQVAAGGHATGERYVQVLKSLRADIDCSIVHPAHAGTALPAGVALDTFDGVTWTGSALNVYHDQPEVRTQIELARAVFAAGVPQFGSCWGLQVAAVAAGGTVRANPRGRELGVARHIALSAAGACHPMFEGKRSPFDAIAVHMDEISALPPDAVVLAANDMSTVQAAEIRHLAGTFWGTQYHPEYDFSEIASVMQRYGRRLVEAGFFADMPTLMRCVGDLRSLHADPARTDIAWQYGISRELLDPQWRRLELRRWLEKQVAVSAE